MKNERMTQDDEKAKKSSKSSTQKSRPMFSIRGFGVDRRPAKIWALGKRIRDLPFREKLKILKKRKP